MDTNVPDIEPADRRPIQRTRRRRRMVAVAIGSVFTLLLLLTAPGGTTARREISKQPLLGQMQDDGSRDALDGARTIVTRSDAYFKVDVLLRTPEPGSYRYPDSSVAPPGVTHPEVTPGSPEVYTLWAFHFQNPELCSDPCNGDDLGDTPAQGGVYQLDAAIADGPWIHVSGIAVNGQPAAAFLPMTDASTTEIHVAIAPHGAAHDDPAALLIQLNASVGSPADWLFGGVHLPDE